MIRKTSSLALTNVEACSFCAVAGFTTAAVCRATSRAKFKLTLDSCITKLTNGDNKSGRP